MFRSSRKELHFDSKIARLSSTPSEELHVAAQIFRHGTCQDLLLATQPRTINDTLWLMENKQLSAYKLHENV